jgi:hypothetical protein
MADAGAGHATTAGPDATPARRSRWWKRVNTAILAAGGLAAAVLAIVALVQWALPDSEPDLENSAQFTAVNIVPSVPLSEYEQRTTLVEAALLEDAGRAPAPVLRLVSDAGGGQPAPSTTAAPPTTPRSTTTAGPSTTAPSTSSRSTTSGSTTTSRPSMTGSSTSGPPGPQQNGGISPPTTQPELVEIGKEVAEDVDCPDPAECQAVRDMVAASSVDLDGNPVPPDVAAERVLEILHNARTDGHEPLGVVVTTDLDLAGLRGEPVFLTWEMFGYGGSTQLHGEWLNENLAYRIEARTDHDTATVDLWIPLPPDPGPYVVKVKATYAGSGLDSAQTDPFG